MKKRLCMIILLTFLASLCVFGNDTQSIDMHGYISSNPSSNGMVEIQNNSFPVINASVQTGYNLSSGATTAQLKYYDNYDLVWTGGGSKVVTLQYSVTTPAVIPTWIMSSGIMFMQISPYNANATDNRIYYNTPTKVITLSNITLSSTPYHCISDFEIPVLGTSVITAIESVQFVVNLTVTYAE